jgi:hypothetical protein
MNLRTLGSVVVLAALALTSTARAEGTRCVNGVYVPADGRLAVKAPTVQIRSYNGRVFIQRAIEPARSRDPMAVRVTGVQPDSTLTIERQAKSKKCELSNGQKLCAHDLPALAKDTVVWKSPAGGKLSFKPNVDSTQAVDVAMYKDPAQVFWPGSRVRVTGTTRDGQAIPEVITTVEGLPAVNEQLYNHATGQVQSWRQSGRLLPSARAWIQEENLYASRPVVDRQSIGKGRTALKQARRAEKTVLALQKYLQTATLFVQTETQKLNAGSYNADPAEKAKVQKAVAKAQSGINKVNQVLSSGPVKKNGQRGPTLASFAQTKKAEGEKLVAAGRVLRSVLVSVGGVPIDAPLQLSNPRHQGDRLPMATASATADKAGYLMAEIGGVREDKVRGEVVFAADANKVGSRVQFEYKIPDGRQSPDLLIDNVRFYKVRPTTVQRVNDQPDAQ